jgi:hypothetical protein
VPAFVAASARTLGVIRRVWAAPSSESVIVTPPKPSSPRKSPVAIARDQPAAFVRS